MWDYFTKWVEGRTVCGKEALTVADAVAHEWILKDGVPVSLQSYRLQAKSLLQRCTKGSVLPQGSLRHTLQLTALNLLWIVEHRTPSPTDTPLSEVLDAPKKRLIAPFFTSWY